jgi:hypothetical protein
MGARRSKRPRPCSRVDSARSLDQSCSARIFGVHLRHEQNSTKFLDPLSIPQTIGLAVHLIICVPNHILSRRKPIWVGRAVRVIALVHFIPPVV